MKKQDAIDRAGSSAALARILGIAPAAISQWGEQVPSARVWQLQVLKPEWFSQRKPSIVAPDEISRASGSELSHEVSPCR
ncbi:Cro/CI family transcriptional regulator [Comamonas kerstersii]|uniref:Cro/CI family transcriptional regulator n=1 Tax=Comamonas kerstersii TaxID=225992 RepID=UPI0009843617|nr:hypothetical protein BMF38_09040 [Comamonas kerstersii]OOH92302.1 hypothetical protein BMF29_08430 [Comamonas kerstersii]